MRKIYVVKLSSEEREELERLVNTGHCSAQIQRRARILLKADTSPEGDGWGDEQIARSLDVGRATAERTRKSFVEKGLEETLRPQRVPRLGSRLLDGEQEAKLVTLACSTPPEGCARWTLRLLADEMVRLEYVASISYETVRQTLKKTISNLIGRNVGRSRQSNRPPSSGAWKTF